MTRTTRRQYRSFRGHAASRVIGPTQDGLTRVETAWYRQDDALNGRQAGSLGMLESYHSAFESSVCGNGWSCVGSAPEFSPSRRGQRPAPERPKRRLGHGSIPQQLRIGRDGRVGEHSPGAVPRLLTAQADGVGRGQRSMGE